MLPRVNLIRGEGSDYLLFSTNDLISTSIYKTGKWADHLVRISSLLIDGLSEPLILDIGANLGAYMIPLAKILDKAGGEIIGFEPQRIVFYQLCGNIVLNRLENCQAFNMAIGDDEGFVEIPEIDYQSNGNVGAFSLQQEYRIREGVEGSMKSKTTKVEMKSLDSLNLSKSPALIKMDVEGYEINVIRGGSEFLKKHHFPPILFEAWTGAWFESRRKELFEEISRLGYRIDAIGGADYLAQHSQNPPSLSFSAKEGGGVHISRGN
jgi:FkbM family methyltransferase